MHPRPGTLAAALAATLILAASAQAQQPAQDRVQRLEAELQRLVEADKENQRRQQILTEEVRKLREQMTIPETKELKGMYGLGPAASKVYTKERGFSIGGYGQAWYTKQVEDKGAVADRVDFQRFVLYNGYKFSDKLVLNSEIEYEHATTGGPGSVSVEFATIDYLADPKLNWRAGLVLIPMGFLNEVHEPLFYHGNQRPEVERQIIPTTFREMGMGVFGNITDEWSYRAYVVNSLRASNFQSAGLRPGRQNGAEALADDYSITVRSDYQVTPELSVGGSVFTGDQGQNEPLRVSAGGATRTVDANTTLYEAHAQYRHKGLELRALGARANVDDADVLSLARTFAASNRGPVGGRMSGLYVEAAYDVMPHLNERSTQYLAPFIRREALDPLEKVPAGFADDPTRDITVTTIGIDYRPDPQVVIKLDHRDFSAERGTRPDEINLGIGWIF